MVAAGSSVSLDPYSAIIIMSSDTTTATGRGRGGRQQQQQQRSSKGRGQGRGRGRPGRNTHSHNNNNSSKPISKKILVLHGNRQTGELLLGRMEKLRKRLWNEFAIQLVAPDGPFEHPDDINLRQWWNRIDNTYEGLELTMSVLQDLWNQDQGSIVGIMGFSQGARLAHLMAVYHDQWQREQSNNNHQQPFAGLQFVILVAGYDVPLPDNWSNVIAPTLAATPSMKLSIPSLHCWGLKDPLIPPQDSEAVMAGYANPVKHIHEGGHHVPMKAPNVQVYVDFIEQTMNRTNQTGTTDQEQQDATSDKTTTQALVPSSPTTAATTTRGVTKSQPAPKQVVPDEETALAQQDEVEALTAIYPQEITLHSQTTFHETTGETTYQHPISYTIALRPEDNDDDDATNYYWPPHPLALRVVYPHDYPNHNGVPQVTLEHENNVMEFSSAHANALLQVVQQTAQDEQGMPSILSCVYAARDFMDSGRILETTANNTGRGGIIGDTTTTDAAAAVDEGHAIIKSAEQQESSTLLRQASVERIHECNMQGLAIAEDLLGRAAASVEAKPSSTTTTTTTTTTTSGSDTTTTAAGSLSSGKGGSWTYTIGLVGKPSAGKSTFFNTASAFARQRDDNENVLGGATMAPHPFTTIDPNIGFCLVPAPAGSCPEEGTEIMLQPATTMNIGSSHGRDSKGRRLLPVLLKDVAGLVPGAYQGRGRGNKFLNDLTDADVLVHVVDASGTADSEGNTVGDNDDDDDNNTKTNGAPSQPLGDLAWIRNGAYVCVSVVVDSTLAFFFAFLTSGVALQN